MTTCTEQEAREKWCPFGRTYRYNDNESTTTVNDPEHAQDSTSCIASQCMAWHAVPPGLPADFHFSARMHERQQQGAHQQEAYLATVAERDDLLAKSEKRGFCGLAGRPA